MAETGGDTVPSLLVGYLCFFESVDQREVESTTKKGLEFGYSEEMDRVAFSRLELKIWTLLPVVTGLRSRRRRPGTREDDDALTDPLDLVSERTALRSDTLVFQLVPTFFKERVFMSTRYLMQCGQLMSANGFVGSPWLAAPYGMGDIVRVGIMELVSMI